ncbi:hypothetical protein SJDPG12_03950, partial [Porphyromonas gingivalis SJD12]
RAASGEAALLFFRPVFLFGDLLFRKDGFLFFLYLKGVAIFMQACFGN